MDNESSIDIEHGIVIIKNEVDENSDSEPQDLEVRQRLDWLVEDERRLENAKREFEKAKQKFNLEKEQSEQELISQKRELESQKEGVEVGKRTLGEIVLQIGTDKSQLEEEKKKLEKQKSDFKEKKRKQELATKLQALQKKKQDLKKERAPFNLEKRNTGQLQRKTRSATVAMLEAETSVLPSKTKQFERFLYVSSKQIRMEIASPAASGSEASSSKSATGNSNRIPIKMPLSGVRRATKPNQFRKLKKPVGRPRLKENAIEVEEESTDDVQLVPSQDSFLDDGTPNSPRKRERERESKKLFHYRRPTYNEEETKALYGDKKYVLDVRDIDKDPSNISIWQILEKKICLRRYFPCKFGQQQFYHSSPQHWNFAEEEFRNEVFYDRFQPIVINKVSNQKHFAEGYKMDRDKCIIQYPYVDKSFFNRMVKYVGKLERTEALRKVLTGVMPLFIMQILQPSYLPDLLRKYKEGHAQIMLGPELAKQIEDWNILDKVIYELLSVAGSSDKCDFNQETLYLLQTFPKMHYSNKSVNKKVHCSACYPKFKRMPLVKVIFNTKPECGTPYDVHTLVEHSNPPKPENDSELWCRKCSTAAKKYHRLAHFRYSLYQIMRQNVAKNVAMFREYDVPITDQCLLMVNDIDVNWRSTHG